MAPHASVLSKVLNTQPAIMSAVYSAYMTAILHDRDTTTGPTGCMGTPGT